VFGQYETAVWVLYQPAETLSMNSANSHGIIAPIASGRRWFARHNRPKTNFQQLVTTSPVIVTEAWTLFSRGPSPASCLDVNQFRIAACFASDTPCWDCIYVDST
jgi:hypothetical protein